MVLRRCTSSCAGKRTGGGASAIAAEEARFPFCSGRWRQGKRRTEGGVEGGNRAGDKERGERGEGRANEPQNSGVCVGEKRVGSGRACGAHLELLDFLPENPRSLLRLRPSQGQRMSTCMDGIEGGGKVRGAGIGGLWERRREGGSPLPLPVRASCPVPGAAPAVPSGAKGGTAES